MVSRHVLKNHIPKSVLVKPDNLIDTLCQRYNNTTNVYTILRICSNVSNTV